MKLIVEQVKKLCKEQNITLAQLEKKLNFGNGTIRRWDDSPPSILKIIEVAKYFDVDLNYFDISKN